MVRDVTEEPSPSRPRFQTVRPARNSKHDIPCGENCLVYPNGKKDYTPDGLLGKVARYLEIDLKTRPTRAAWVEKKGRRRKRGGRHRDCERPNRFYPVAEGAEEEELLDVDADEGGDAPMEQGEGGGGELWPADEVALAWARRDAGEQARPDEVRAMVAEPGHYDWGRAIEGEPTADEADAYTQHRGPAGRIQTFHVRRVGVEGVEDPYVPPPPPPRGFV